MRERVEIDGGHPRRAFGTRVTTAVKDADGRRRGERDAHVWHCSLNLSAEETR